MNADRATACDLLVLCGGQGTRLRPAVNDRPKPLAMIGSRPFLDWVIDPFLQQGISRVILCTGYLGDHFETQYAPGTRSCELVFSQEETPLGTAGAVRHAIKWVRNNLLVVVNGDSVCRVDLNALLAFHAGKHARATLTLTRADHRCDVGVVTMDAHSRITQFSTQGAGHKAGLHNAGIYVFDRAALDVMPVIQPCSLESQWLPALLPGGVYGFVSQGPLYDIGTPERLAHFRAITAPDDPEQTACASTRPGECAPRAL